MIIVQLQKNTCQGSIHDTVVFIEIPEKVFKKPPKEQN